MFSRKWASHFRFFDFLIPFYVDPDPNPVPKPGLGPECIPVRFLILFRSRQGKKLRFLQFRFRFHNTACILFCAGVYIIDWYTYYAL